MPVNHPIVLPVIPRCKRIRAKLIADVDNTEPPFKTRIILGMYIDFPGRILDRNLGWGSGEWVRVHNRNGTMGPLNKHQMIVFALIFDSSLCVYLEILIELISMF